MNVVEVHSKLEKKIRLTRTQWNHITLKHHELIHQESKIQITLSDPDFVLYSKEDENYQYHRKFSDTPIGEKYLLVVVKHLNGDGFVITAFFLSKPKEKDKVKIYEK